MADQPSLATIYRTIKRVVETTPSDWNHATYLARLATALRAAGFTVYRQVKVASRGSPDGRPGRLAMVLHGYATIEVDGAKVNPSSLHKLSQAPKDSNRLLLVVLRLGSVPDFMLDPLYIPPYPPTQAQLAQLPNLAVISAPIP